MGCEGEEFCYLKSIHARAQSRGEITKKTKSWTRLKQPEKSTHRISPKSQSYAEPIILFR